MVVPPVSLRTHEVYTEVILLSMEIIILLGSAWLCYTLLLILQTIFSYTGVILLSIGAIVLLTIDPGRNSSRPMATGQTLMEISKKAGHMVVCITNKLREKPVKHADSESKFSRIVAMWTTYAAYVGLLVQVFFRYPISGDTFFAGGLIGVAIAANHAFLFSYLLASTKNKSKGHDFDQSGRQNEIDEGELQEIRARYDEDRPRWEQEKRDLTVQLEKARTEASALIEKAKQLVCLAISIGISHCV